MCDQPNWVAVLAALGTPIVALLAGGLAGFIGYRQWQTAQDRLKLDLFDRRFALYEKTWNFLTRCMALGKAEGREITDFVLGTRSSKWLFNREIAAYLEDEVGAKALKLESLDSELETLSESGAPSDNVAKQRELKNWLRAQFDVIDEKFAPYLSLRH